MTAWEFCLKYCGISEGFTHKMAECEFCLQGGGNSEFYPQYGGVEFFAYKMVAFPTVLPTRWQWGRFAYKMAAFLRVLPTRWQRVSFAYKMAAILRVLPTIWQCGSFAYKMAAMQNKQNVNRNNVEYALRLQCRLYLVNAT